MKSVFYNKNQQIRNGWWILLFIAFVALTSVIYTPISRFIQSFGVDKDWLGPLSVSFVLVATWACCSLRKTSLTSVGLVLNKSWLIQFGFGILVSTLMVLFSVTVIWCFSDMELQLNPDRSLLSLTSGLYLFLFVALYEELLFRGFVFQRLIDGLGVFWAQLLLAALFSLGHWGNPGMEGTALVIASLDLFVGALLFGFAYIRTGSLALPIGLHLGWNWAQGHLMGFSVSGIEQSSWFQPVITDSASWLSGGQFGLEASIVTLLFDAIVVLLLWRWKSSSQPLVSNELHQPVTA